MAVDLAVAVIQRQKMEAMADLAVVAVKHPYLHLEEPAILPQQLLAKVIMVDLILILAVHMVPVVVVEQAQ
jgi:hypothetical protein